MLLRKRQLTTYRAYIRAKTIILTDVIGMCVVRAGPNWVSEMHPRGRWPSLCIRGLPPIDRSFDRSFPSWRDSSIIVCTTVRVESIEHVRGGERKEGFVSALGDFSTYECCAVLETNERTNELYYINRYLWLITLVSTIKYDQGRCVIDCRRRAISA